jgi:hypothetical protein
MRAVTALAMVFAFSQSLGSAEPSRSGLPQPEEVRRQHPRLELRASPRLAFPPVNVFLTAELVGGYDTEEYYCPGLEWDWGDGGRSVNASECEPFEEGVSLQRRFTAEHAYRSAGVYRIRVTLHRQSRSLAKAEATVTVRDTE